MKDEKFNLDYFRKYLNKNFICGKLEINNAEKFNEANSYKDKKYEVIKFEIEKYFEDEELDEEWEDYMEGEWDE